MSHLNQLHNKIVDQGQLNQRLSMAREDGRQIVFTNGCFDILHKGHVEYLAQAADKGDFLVVGLNSDASVKRQGKGDDRPVNTYPARATILAALSFVDLIVDFDDDTPIHLIKMIVPDILVKGGDYNPDQVDQTAKDYIVGREIVLDNGGSVEVISLVEGYSTTSLIEKMKK